MGSCAAYDYGESQSSGCSVDVRPPLKNLFLESPLPHIHPNVAQTKESGPNMNIHMLYSNTKSQRKVPSQTIKKNKFKVNITHRSQNHETEVLEPKLDGIRERIN